MIFGLEMIRDRVTQMALAQECEIRERKREQELKRKEKERIKEAIRNKKEEARQAEKSKKALEEIRQLMPIDPALIADAASEIYDRSYEYTPEDTGRLRDSQYINTDSEEYIEIGYSSSKCDYAIYVHEMPLVNHEAPTRYKFLEDAAYEVYGEYLARYGVAIPIKIQYKPDLRVFIGSYYSPGQLLTKVKKNEKRVGDPEYISKVLSRYLELVNMESLEGLSKRDMMLKNIMEFYTKRRGFDLETASMVFVDRIRHK